MPDKMTAVEFLIDQLGIKLDGWNNSVIKEAKAMEKEQIQKAYDKGAEDACEMFYQMSKSQEQHFK